MAETKSGRWAARSTFRAVSRQNGKGDEVEVVEFFGLTQRAEAIVHTAHEIPTAKSAHQRLAALFDHRDFRSRIKIRYANGDQQIEHRGKEGRGIIVYRTRTAGGGRGLDDISRLVIDEAQHAQPEQLASSTPILAANPNPQLNFTGTAGILGRSDWWWTLRKRAIAGDDDGFAALEHSAEQVELNSDGRVVSVPPNPSDRSAWALANPAFGLRLEEAYLAEQFKVLGPELFAREHLGVWDPCDDGLGGLVPSDAWQASADAETQASSSLAYGLSVSSDGSWAAISSAGRRADGRLHVTTVEHRRATGWVVDFATDLHSRRRVPMRLNPAAAEGAFIRPLLDAGVEVVEVSQREYAQACGRLLDAVKNDRLRHLGQESMDRAVNVATRRDIGTEGGWAWAQSGPVDITPLKAATLALTGVVEAQKFFIY